ncbi:hypothetical protein [Saccharopolyspora sp. NPDC003762]
MTGPEHYREAERLLRRGDPDYIAEAQVHATLALAAATAFTGTATNGQDAIADPTGIEWWAVIKP